MMTTDNEASNATLQRKPFLRNLLVLPPIFLVAAGCVLLVVSPSAWDAADNIEAPAWMPPTIGLLAALGGLWIGLYALKATLTATSGDFEVFGLQTVFGVIMFVSGGLLMLSLAFRLPDSGTYAGMIDDDGEVTISSLGFFIVSLALAAFNIGWIWVGAYLYSHAISNQQPNRISQRYPGEVDGVGALLREFKKDS